MRCALLALPLFLAFPQEGDQQAAALEFAKLRAGLERRAHFLDAWQDASSEARARAARVLRLEREGAQRASSTPSTRALTRAWRALVEESEDPFEEKPLRALVDSLDLRVLPGYFQGQPEGKPQALTVRVSQLYHVEAETPVELTLTWREASGREVHARTEPISARAFVGVGFEMYVRAPSVIPGTWTLVPRLDWEGESATGVSISVLGIDHAEELVDPEDVTARRELALLREYGIRPLFERAFMAALGLLPTEDKLGWRGARPVAFEGEAFESLELGDRTVWGLGVADVAEPKGIVFLLPPDDERPEAALVGEMGEAWSDVARRNEWWVLTSDLPLRADTDSSVLGLATALHARHPKAERVLVARGGALLQVQLARMHRPSWSFERMVVSTVLGSEVAPRNLPGVAGLFVASESQRRESGEVTGDDDAKWALQRRTEPQIVTDLELPSLLEAWAK